MLSNIFILNYEGYGTSVAQCLLEAYPSTVNLIATLISALIGVGGALLGITHYLEDARKKACFGFYYHVLLYLQRMEKILKSGHALSCLWDPAAYKKEVDPQFILGAPAIKASYTKLFRLCQEFRYYLSSTDNNVPPKGKRPKSPEWQQWYKDLQTLSGLFLDIENAELNATHEYFNDTHLAAYSVYKQELERSVQSMSTQIKEVLKI